MTLTAPVRRLGRVPALDGLRGVAVLVVVLYHTAVLLLAAYSPLAALGGRSVLIGGFLGVDVFFVLSGFLITALLLREQGDHDGRVRFGAFYGRRALRLLPALFVLLAAHAVYATLAGLPRDAESETILSALVYVTNWQAAWHPNSLAEGLGHLWSLSVEEQFYLVWPTILVLLLSLRRSTKVVVTVLVIAIGLIAVHRAVMWQHGTTWLFLLVRTDTRADSLLVGALLASLWVRGRTPTRGLVPAGWIGAGALVSCFVFTRDDSAWLYRGGFTLIAVAAAAVILATVDGHWRGARFLELAPLRLVGRVSYGLYLWHLAIFVAVARYGTHEPKLLRVTIAYCLTALCTALSWALVEHPALRWKQALRVEPLTNVN